MKSDGERRPRLMKIVISGMAACWTSNLPVAGFNTDQPTGIDEGVLPKWIMISSQAHRSPDWSPRQPK